MKKAKELGINVSACFRDYLKIVLYGNKKLELTPQLDEHINDFMEVAKRHENWRKFVLPRCRRIKNMTGVDIGAEQLEIFVLERLKGCDKNDKSEKV